MRIDPHIFDNTPTVPTAGSLQSGTTFIYKGNVYMKVADTDYHSYQAINLVSGELICDDELPNEAGVTVVEIIITRIN